MKDAREQEMHIDWRSILNVVGLSSLIAAILGWWLASRREQRRWVLDNKKLEWRELIDALHDALCTMGYAFQPMRIFKRGEEGDVDSAIENGFRVIRDRIFIADAIERHRVMEQWKGLVAYIHAATSPRDPGQHAAGTFTEFNARGAAFEDKLLLMARDDLKV